MIAPNSRIILLKTPIELDENNQLTFSTKTAQYNYFHSLTRKELDNATFQRKDGVLRFETNEDDFTFDDVLQYNYCMYQNTSYGDKWFYAFITKATYINNGLTDLELKTDVFQTWYFDASWKRCFVEREHIATADDTIGANTLPEGLETGEYIINNIGIFDDSNSKLSNTDICMGVSWTPSNITQDNRQYGGVYSGLTYYVFSDATSCSLMCKAYDDLAKADAIYSIFLIPRKFEDELSLSFNTYTLGNQSGIVLAIVPSSTYASNLLSNITISSPTTLNGYTPKNKKLFTYPYNYLYITNNGGIDVTFNYEDFVNNTPTFNVKGVIATGGSIRLVPSNYKKYSTQDNYPNYDNPYGLSGSKYPTCSWTSDAYTNWLTQNAVNIPLQIAGSVISTGAGIMTGNALGTASGMLGIAQTLGTIYEHSLIPEQAKGNTNSGDVIMGMRMINFTYYKMSIRSEYARIIDDFFSMYGYKTNRVKIPNTNNRSNWNYVKTINANIIGDVPQDDMQELKDIFNKGVTLWHHASTFLDYSQTNS